MPIFVHHWEGCASQMWTFSLDGDQARQLHTHCFFYNAIRAIYSLTPCSPLPSDAIGKAKALGYRVVAIANIAELVNLAVLE